AFAAAGWIGLSLLFAWYTSNFGSYNKTYGSLGAVIGFMTWIWLSIIVILLGAELHAQVEPQTRRDTTVRPPQPNRTRRPRTVGPPKPIGTRGATMADTIGKPAD